MDYTNELWYMVKHIPSPQLGFIINQMRGIFSLKNDRTGKKVAKVTPFYGSHFVDLTKLHLKL